MRQAGSEFISTVADFFGAIGPGGDLIYLTIQLALFCALCGLSLFFIFYQTSCVQLFQKKISLDVVFCLVVLSFVMVSRFPAAIYGWQNPDEGVWIACTKALLNDPRPWVSADTTTSGPLVLIPVALLRLLGLPIDFGSIKIAAAMTMSATMVFTYLTYRNLFGRAIASVCVIFALVMISLTNFWDFVTYNGEYVPLLLLAGAQYFLSKEFMGMKPGFSNLVYAALLLGMTPFAKLQSVPLALIISVAGYVLVWRGYSRYQVLLYTLAGVAPTVLMLGWIGFGGGLDHFFKSYILFSFHYAGSAAPAEASWTDIFVHAWYMIFHADDFTVYFSSAFTICVFLLLAMNYRSLFRAKAKIVMIVFSILYFIVSLYCIGQTFRGYGHYTYLTYFAFSLLTASLLAGFLQHDSENSYTRRRSMCCVILFVSSLMFYSEFTFDPTYLHHLEAFRANALHESEVIEVINSNSAKGDRIAIWGWNNLFYGETDLIMAFRYTDTAGIMEANFLQDYFTNLYLSDLERNKPRIFLDVVNQYDQKFRNRSEFGLNRFPPVKAFVDDNFRKVASIHGFDVYVRE